MSITGYARVSTDDQDLTSQIAALSAAWNDPNGSNAAADSAKATPS